MQIKSAMAGAAALVAASLLATTAAHGQAAEGDDTQETAAAKPYQHLKRSEWKVQPGPFPVTLSENSPSEDVIPVVADRIFELGAERGYAELRNDYDKRAVSVLWKGKPPADVLAYIASRPFGVDITLDQTARYSRYELEEARGRYLNSPKRASMDVVWTDIDMRSKGLRIGIARSRGLGAAELSEVRTLAGVEHVDVVAGAKHQKLLSSRNNDSAPWQGGARIVSTWQTPQGTQCHVAKDDHAAGDAIL